MVKWEKEAENPSVSYQSQIWYFEAGKYDFSTCYRVCTNVTDNCGNV